MRRQRESGSGSSRREWSGKAQGSEINGAKTDGAEAN